MALACWPLNPSSPPSASRSSQLSCAGRASARAGHCCSGDLHWRWGRGGSCQGAAGWARCTLWRGGRCCSHAGRKLPRRRSAPATAAPPLRARNGCTTAPSALFPSCPPHLSGREEYTGWPASSEKCTATWTAPTGSPRCDLRPSQPRTPCSVRERAARAAGSAQPQQRLSHSSAGAPAGRARHMGGLSEAAQCSVFRQGEARQLQHAGAQRENRQQGPRETTCSTAPAAGAERPAAARKRCLGRPRARLLPLPPSLPLQRRPRSAQRTAPLPRPGPAVGGATAPPAAPVEGDKGGKTRKSSEPRQMLGPGLQGRLHASCLGPPRLV